MSANSRESLELPPTVDRLDGGAAFPSGAYRANLYVYDPFGRIEWFALVPHSFTNGRYFSIGRGVDCDITLNDGSVSTRHAYIAGEGAELVLHDRQSTNGSLVNGARVERHALRHGDLIRLGATDIRFLLSYRESPVHLVLDFVAGVNAGKSIATYGASTNIGRLNCAINLQGGGVAAQHVRVDAFGHDLLFVVNLHDENETWLNGSRLVGIAAAREGDVLQVGEHEIVLRIVDDDALSDAVPQGDGTLLLGQDSGSAKAPLIQMSAFEMARLEAHLQDLPSDAADRTELDMQQLEPEVLERSRARTLQSDPPAPGWGFSAPPAERTGPPAPSAAELPETDEAEWAPPRRDLGWLRWLLVPTVVGLLAGILSLVPMERSFELSGTLAAASEAPLTATVRGRVEHLYLRAGDQVKEGDAVARLVDLGVREALDEVNGKLDAIRQRREEARPTVQRIPVPSTLRARIGGATAAVDAASAELRARREQFNRREIGIDALQATQKKLRRAAATLSALETEADAYRSRKRVVLPSGPSVEELEEEIELKARRAQLEEKLHVSVVAGLPGALVDAGPKPLEVGAVVEGGQALFRVVETNRLVVEFAVPPKHLTAVEGLDTLEVAPAGSTGRALTVRAGKLAAAPSADGSFRWSAAVDNAAGTLRPGQAVTTTVPLPDVSALSWLLERDHR